MKKKSVQTENVEVKPAPVVNNNIASANTPTNTTGVMNNANNAVLTTPPSTPFNQSHISPMHTPSAPQVAPQINSSATMGPRMGPLPRQQYRPRYIPRQMRHNGLVTSTGPTRGRPRLLPVSIPLVPSPPAPVVVVSAPSQPPLSLQQSHVSRLQTSPKPAQHPPQLNATANSTNQLQHLQQQQQQQHTGQRIPPLHGQKGITKVIPSILHKPQSIAGHKNTS